MTPMAILGRLLQVIGWIWVAIGFFGPLVNLPFDLNFFPGIIIVFVARILRTQAARNTPEQGETQVLEEQAQPRVLNTERSKVPEPAKRPRPEPAGSGPPKPKPEAIRQEKLDEILAATTERATGPDSSETETPEMVEPPPSDSPPRMSSAEMVAQARKRWNKS